MNCCQPTINGLDVVFDSARAREEADDYLENGLDKPARLVLQALKAQSIAGASVLEVGGGAGGLHLELLKAGAARALDVDASPAYVEVARETAERLGFKEAVEHRRMDFAREAADVPAADAVVMHRVVCCYPDMRGLVEPAARRARRLLALTFPRGFPGAKALEKIAHFFFWLTRSEFKFYLHPPAEIIGAASAEGLRLIYKKYSGLWQIVVFSRESAPGSGLVNI